MAESLTFQEIVDKTLDVIRKFKDVETREWGAEGCVIELSKQVGDLSKQVMSFEGYYDIGRDSLPEYQSSKEKIANELADILFILIKLADHYKIDLEEAHLKELDIALNHPFMKLKKK